MSFAKLLTIYNKTRKMFVFIKNLIYICSMIFEININNFVFI